jgi:hypothetical protein
VLASPSRRIEPDGLGRMCVKELLQAGRMCCSMTSLRSVRWKPAGADGPDGLYNTILQVQHPARPAPADLAAHDSAVRAEPRIPRSADAEDGCEVSFCAA